MQHAQPAGLAMDILWLGSTILVRFWDRAGPAALAMLMILLCWPSWPSNFSHSDVHAMLAVQHDCLAALDWISKKGCKMDRWAALCFTTAGRVGTKQLSQLSNSALACFPMLSIICQCLHTTAPALFHMDLLEVTCHTWGPA